MFDVVIIKGSGDYPDAGRAGPVQRIAFRVYRESLQKRDEELMQDLVNPLKALKQETRW